MTSHFYNTFDSLVILQSCSVTSLSWNIELSCVQGKLDTRILFVCFVFLSVLGTVGENEIMVLFNLLPAKFILKDISELYPHRNGILNICYE